MLLIVGQWYNPAYDDRGPQKFNPEYHRSEPDLGRHVNHNRPSTASLPPPQPHQTHDPGQGQPPHPPHHSQVGGYKCIEMINPSPQHALINTWKMHDKLFYLSPLQDCILTYWENQ